MSQNSGYRKGKMRTKGATPKSHDENNAAQNAFAKYSQELDDKHDRQERLVKLSRDVTIEAKRIIFLLHTIDERKNNRTKILNEAEERLQKVIATNFKAVTKELAGLDVYQYRYAYSPGLQEFIEAYTFMEYLKNEVEDEKEGAQLSDWQALQKKMHFEDVEKPAASDKDSESDAKSSELNETEAKTEYSFMVCPHEYILGLSDLTGELMRRCINALGSGETATCLETCKALQQFYTGYIGLNVQRSRELSRKIFTMRQSVLKTENVCYNVKVRGGEAAKWGAVYDVKHSDDIDEGFF